MSYAVWNLTHLANFGMTLFFVLSGFVIHWNYRNVVQQPSGLWAFFVARWSRLYPLFLVLFVVGTIYGVATKGQAWRMAEMTPYFLTFTTSWWYWQFDGAYIFDGLNNAVLGVTWSLATEAFFYCTYPLLAPLTSKLSQRGAAVGLVVAGAVGAAMSLAFISYSNEIIAFASKYLGITTGSQFLFWLGFHSPWMRFPSFLVGVFAAQLSLSGFRIRPIVADIVAVLCLVAIFALAQQRTLTAMVDSSVLALCFAGICLCASIPRSLFALALSMPLMIWGGEASYSLYLLHDPIVWLSARAAFGLHLPVPALWLTLSIAVAVIVARLSYERIERPAQRFFRAVGGHMFGLRPRRGIDPDDGDRGERIGDDAHMESAPERVSVTSR
jgi:peptidoglycan/LPS O-acetylase OafA/YrhL